MTEEQVTKAILKHLIEQNWTIVTYDFPQSGTGKMIHPDKNISEKNKNSIIPDIVAVKNGICLFFENKNRTVAEDFYKIDNIKTGNAYLTSISAMLASHKVQLIYYGIGLPLAKWKQKQNKLLGLVDFVLGVGLDWSIEFLNNPNEIDI